MEYSLIYALFYIALIVHIKSQKVGHEKKTRIFTHEWQELGADEAIPAGLHVRINLQTGKKEAKLLDRVKDVEDERHTSLAVVGEEQGEGEMEELRHRLSQIPDEGQLPTPEEIEKVKKKFRPYDELKKEFDSLKMSVKTDLEVMDELFAKYEKMVGEGESGRLAVVTELGYMVHQVDNARQFVQAGGLSLVVFPSLNSSSVAVRCEAARLLGTAVQNNAPSKIKALEEGALGVLLRALALDPSAEARSSALYALGCLTRNFPLAQTRLVEQGGLAVLANQFHSQSAQQLKLQVKVVALVDDLLVERADAERDWEEGGGGGEAAERVRQYRATDLPASLTHLHWCGLLSGLLERELPGSGGGGEWANAADGPDPDTVEKITRAMLSLAQPCREEFLKDGRMGKRIPAVIGWLKELAASEEGDDDYYQGLSRQVKALGKALGVFHTDTH